MAYVVTSSAILMPWRTGVLLATTLLFLLSGFVAAAGLSLIVDLVPPARRGLATGVSFFFNVALGAGIGPVLVPILAPTLTAYFGDGAVALGGAMAVLAAITLLPMVAMLGLARRRTMLR
jgi:hypothetical protein